ncbi:MAG TPA: HAD family hydrolase [Candidatus Obscuribacterales bacterium]
MTKTARPAVFLDRDGTLNVEIGYIRDVDDLRLIDGAAEAVKRLNEANLAAILVTNQSGAARGFYPERHIQDLNQRLLDLLKAGGAYLDAVYYCPHHPEAVVKELAGPCSCRKPEVGMLERAFSEFELDRKRSFVVGDKATDVELARNAGIYGILVRTGYGDAVVKGEYQHPVEPDFDAPSIAEAVDWILAQVALVSG